MAFLDSSFSFMNAEVDLRDSIVKNDREGVQKALDNDADINSASLSVPYVIMSAQKELWDMVKFLVDKGAIIDAPNRYDWTLMHEAAKKAPVDITKWLVEEGASMIRPDRSGARPLLIAAKNSRWDNVAEMLRFSDSGVGFADKDGFLALHYACRDGNEEMIEALAPFEPLAYLNVNEESPWDLLPTKDLKEKYDSKGEIAAALEKRLLKNAELEASSRGNKLEMVETKNSNNNDNNNNNNNDNNDKNKDKKIPAHSVQGLSVIRKRRVA